MSVHINEQYLSLANYLMAHGVLISDVISAV